MKTERFAVRHESVTLTAGQSRVLIYKYELTIGHEVGFWEEMANTWAGLTFYEIYVDGKYFEKLERVIGDSESPYRWDPPIVFEDSIVIYGTNNDVASHVFEVILGGQIVDKRYMNESR